MDLFREGVKQFVAKVIKLPKDEPESKKMERAFEQEGKVWMGGINSPLQRSRGLSLIKDKVFKSHFLLLSLFFFFITLFIS